MTPHDEARALAEQWVRRWFCQNNEVLWERGGHYQEEVEALMVLLREVEARGLEDSADHKEECNFAGQPDDMISWCRAQAASLRGGG